MSPTRSRVLAGDRPNTAPPAPREAPLPRSEVRKEADRACPHPRPARVSVWGRRLRRRADPPRRRGAQAGATQRQGHVRAQGVRCACRGPPPPPRQARTVRRACGRRAARERATGCGQRNVVARTSSRPKRVQGRRPVYAAGAPNRVTEPDAGHGLIAAPPGEKAPSCAVMRRSPLYNTRRLRLDCPAAPGATQACQAFPQRCRAYLPAVRGG